MPDIIHCNTCKRLCIMPCFRRRPVWLRCTSWVVQSSASANRRCFTANTKQTPVTKSSKQLSCQPPHGWAASLHTVGTCSAARHDPALAEQLVTSHSNESVHCTIDGQPTDHVDRILASTVLQNQTWRRQPIYALLSGGPEQPMGSLMSACP